LLIEPLRRLSEFREGEPEDVTTQRRGIIDVLGRLMGATLVCTAYDDKNAFRSLEFCILSVTVEQLPNAKLFIVAVGQHVAHLLREAFEVLPFQFVTGSHFLRKIRLLQNKSQGVNKLPPAALVTVEHFLLSIEEVLFVTRNVSLGHNMSNVRKTDDAFMTLSESSIMSILEPSIVKGTDGVSTMPGSMWNVLTSSQVDDHWTLGYNIVQDLTAGEVVMVCHHYCFSPFINLIRTLVGGSLQPREPV